jgi:hypothetical protein
MYEQKNNDTKDNKRWRVNLIKSCTWHYREVLQAQF